MPSYKDIFNFLTDVARDIKWLEVYISYPQGNSVIKFDKKSSIIVKVNNSRPIHVGRSFDEQKENIDDIEFINNDLILLLDDIKKYTNPYDQYIGNVITKKQFEEFEKRILEFTGFKQTHLH